MIRVVKKSRFFSRTLRSYAVILAVPILMFCVFFYRQIYVSDRQAVRKDCFSRAHGIAESFNQKLVNANDMGNQFLTSDWIKRAGSDMTDEHFGPLEKADIVQELAVCKSISGIFADMAVILPGRNTVISQSGWWDMDSYFTHCGIDGAEKQSAFLGEMGRINYTGLVNLRAMGLQLSDSNNLILVQTLDTIACNQAFFVLTFDSNILDSYLSTNDSGLLRLTVRNDRTELYSYQSPEYSKYRKNSLTVRIPSKIYPWTYDVSLPYDRFPKLFADFSVLLAAVLLSVVFGGAAAYALTLVSYKPLKKLMLRIGVASGKTCEGAHEYSVIEKTFGAMADERKKLEDSVAQYKNITRSNLIANLLKGYFDIEKIKPQLAQYAIPYDDGQYYTVVLCDCGGAENETDRSVDTFFRIKAGLQAQKAAFEILEIPDGCIGVIFHLDRPPSEREIRVLMQRVGCPAGGPGESRFSFYTGTVERGLIGISKSYQAAKDVYIRAAFQAIRAEGDSGVPSGSRCFYPTDWEFQIVNQLKVGNVTLIHKIMEELKLENEKRNPPPAENEKLRSLIFETIVRVMDELNIDSEKPMRIYQRIVRQGNAEKQWEYIGKLADHVCTRTAYRSKTVEKSTGAKILEYVRANYRDASLSLKRLSETFGLSDSAVSKIFKDTERINFSEYLSRIRIDKAKAYLADGTLSMADVAHKVGYESVLSFKRVFMRCEGVSPREYMLHFSKKELT